MRVREVGVDQIDIVLTHDLGRHLDRAPERIVVDRRDEDVEAEAPQRRRERALIRAEAKNLELVPRQIGDETADVALHASDDRVTDDLEKADLGLRASSG